MWNAKNKGTLENNHYPVLPDLSEEDGWAPIETYLDLILKDSPKVKIMFEHRSDLISEAELMNCYSWISSIVDKNKIKSL